jgi:hypothetical protein
MYNTKIVVSVVSSVAVGLYVIDKCMVMHYSDGPIYQRFGGFAPWIYFCRYARRLLIAFVFFVCIIPSFAFANDSSDFVPICLVLVVISIVALLDACNFQRFTPEEDVPLLLNGVVNDAAYDEGDLPPPAYALVDRRRVGHTLFSIALIVFAGILQTSAIDVSSFGRWLVLVALIVAVALQALASYKRALEYMGVENRRTVLFLRVSSSAYLIGAVLLALLAVEVDNNPLAAFIEALWGIWAYVIALLIFGSRVHLMRRFFMKQSLSSEVDPPRCANRRAAYERID